MSNPSSSLYVIVPVFNEAANIESLFQAFRTLSAEFGADFAVHFVIVDDGSSDETVASARGLSTGLNANILCHPVNKGPGGAFATGFGYLADKLGRNDWVITMEGDNTSRHELIRQMFVRTREGYDVILASPYMYGGGFSKTSLLRKFLSSGANLVVKDLLGIQGILTVSSFFRLYRGAVLLELQQCFGPGIVERLGFESMVELLMKLIMRQTTISEVPMLLDSSRRQGKSKMKILRTILGYFSLWQCKKHWVLQAGGGDSA